MEPIKYLALQRGIKGFSFSGYIMPIEGALEHDQLAPLLIASAAHSYEHSGMYSPQTPFPWALGESEEEDSPFEANVITQTTGIPMAVGYLFVDYEIERALMSMDQTLEETNGVVPLDILAERLEMTTHESNWHYLSNAPAL